MFRRFRIAILLYILILVGGGAWLTSRDSTDWEEPLWVLVYPINADHSKASDSYIRNLEPDHFAAIEGFFSQQGRAYGLKLEQPVTIRVATPLFTFPPSPPRARNTLSVMWWSLKLRYWVWKVEKQQSEPHADIKVFALYHDPKLVNSLPHSLGLQKGLIGVVHAFAAPHMSESNNVVIAHEIMHTVGASDKYDSKSGQPIYPDGYAQPNLKPRYPQLKAEITGGRIPLGEKDAQIPRSLKQVVVGQQTAIELDWLTY